MRRARTCSNWPAYSAPASLTLPLTRSPSKSPAAKIKSTACWKCCAPTAYWKWYAPASSPCAAGKVRLRSRPPTTPITMQPRKTCRTRCKCLEIDGLHVTRNRDRNRGKIRFRISLLFCSTCPATRPFIPRLSSFPRIEDLITEVSLESLKSLFLKALAGIYGVAGHPARPQCAYSYDWCNQRCHRSAFALSFVERSVSPCQAVHHTGRDCGIRHPDLRWDSPEQQEHRRVHLLSGHRHTGVKTQGESAGHHRNLVGEFSFHPDRHSGTQLHRDADSGRGLNAGAVSLSGAAQGHSGDVQRLRGIDLNRARLPGVSPPGGETAGGQ